MPQINIEEKIQEALKKKSFKENKVEYLALSFVFCMVLFFCFVASYFLPILGIILFFAVVIPFIMGFKHFIWFGPASGETLFEGFKVSIACGYLNYIYYTKLFFVTNLRAFFMGLLSYIASTIVGVSILYSVNRETIRSIVETHSTAGEVQEALMQNSAITSGMQIIMWVSIAIFVIVFYLFKLNRALLPYTSFLRLIRVDGKGIDDSLSHMNKIKNTKRAKYNLTTTLYHLLLLIPIGIAIGVYFLLKLNPTFSETTISIVTMASFFITVFPVVLFIELNYRNFCIEINQEYMAEHKQMLNDALNDIDQDKKS